jgi:DNA-binding NtrC family response regulator
LILIVEDDFSIRALLARTLETAGYRTDCAWNGREALDRLNQRAAKAIIMAFNPGDTERATLAALGAQLLLDKPITPGPLLAGIAALLPSGQGWT